MVKSQLFKWNGGTKIVMISWGFNIKDDYTEENFILDSRVKV